MRLKPIEQSAMTPRALFLLASIPLIILIGGNLADVRPYENMYWDEFVMDTTMLGAVIVCVTLGFVLRRRRLSRNVSKEG